jgi:hypothetical protein
MLSSCRLLWAVGDPADERPQSQLALGDLPSLAATLRGCCLLPLFVDLMKILCITFMPPRPIATSNGRASESFSIEYLLMKFRTCPSWSSSVRTKCLHVFDFVSGLRSLICPSVRSALVSLSSAALVADFNSYAFFLIYRKNTLRQRNAGDGLG